MGRLSWIILVHPVESQSSLNGEKEAEDQKEKGHLENTQLVIIGFEDGGRGPWAKKCRQPPEEEKGKDFLLEPLEGYNPADTSILAQWDTFGASGIQNYKIINLCCF